MLKVRITKEPCNYVMLQLADDSRRIRFKEYFDSIASHGVLMEPFMKESYYGEAPSIVTYINLFRQAIEVLTGVHEWEEAEKKKAVFKKAENKKCVYILDADSFEEQIKSIRDAIDILDKKCSL